MSRRSARRTGGLLRAARGGGAAARRRPYHRHLSYEPLEARRLLAVLTVGNPTDLVNGNVASISALMADPGADGISLREAIQATNATGGQDEIQFAPSLTSGGPATILLTAGELVISDAVKINGLGADVLTIDAGSDPMSGMNGNRAFRVGSSGLPIDVTISHLSITGGQISSLGDDRGAGILNYANLTLRAVSIHGNHAQIGGDSGRGGGIANVQGLLTLDSSVVFDNDAAVGGGILNDGQMTIVNSTISGNRAEFAGGGISHGFGTSSISYSTITLNLVNSSGGGSGVNSGGGLQVKSSIIAGNDADDDVSGGFTSQGFNLVGGGTGTGAFAPSETGFTSPLLEPLADNSGPTPTHALLAGSPASDAGDPDAIAGENGVPRFDQRGDGFSRVVGGRIDIGAFEKSISNRDPQLPNPGPQTASEGNTFSLNGLFNFTDADTADTHTATVDWGDGSAIDSLVVIPASGGGSLSGGHVFADDGIYQVRVTVFDNQGGNDAETFSVAVANTNPNLVVAPDQTIDEGTLLDLSALGGASALGLFVDAGVLDTHTATANWGDGSPAESLTVFAAAGAGVLGGKHTYTDKGIYVVTVIVTDDDGGSALETFQVTVLNVAPSINSLSITTPINEGQSATLSGTYSDPGISDTHELDVDWDGDNIVDQTIAVTGGTFSVTHLYPDDDPTGTTSDTITVHVRLRDAAGASAAAAAESLTVNNELPELTVAANQTVNQGELLNLLSIGNPLGTFTDAGILDTHTGIVDWGDGSPADDVAIADLGGNGFLAASHVYSTPGTHQVTVTLRDDDGGERLATFSVEVIETPSLEVTTDQDVVGNDGFTSLREAIALADSTPGADTVTFHSTMNGKSVELMLGELKISDSVTIDATSLNTGLVVSGGERSRIFNVDDTSAQTRLDVTIEGLHLTGGNSPGDGGAIVNRENLTLRNIVIDGSFSAARGGGIANLSGGLTVERSTISGNTARFATTGDNGSDAVNGAVSTLYGGGIYSGYGSLVIRDSTIVGNTADVGGGVFSHSEIVSITGSTIGENFGALGGGGVWAGSSQQPLPFEIRHSTIYRNSSNAGGSGLQLYGDVAATISHTIIAGNTVSGQMSDFSFSDSIQPVVQFSLIGTSADLHLGPLMDNGGPTHTYALLPGSPALNAGDPSAQAEMNGVPKFDQRGNTYSRVRGGQIDIGAFEVQNDLPELVVPGPQTVFEGAELDLSQLVSFSDVDFSDQHTATVSWGDGSDPVMLVVNQDNGSGIVPAKHVYADDGSYLVTVTIADAFESVSKEFNVTVENVAPTLGVTSSATSINEGQSVSFETMFSDPGFDNPLNPGGAAVESFRYFVDWRDGRDQVGNMPVADINGMPGIPSTGMFGGNHTYADDGIYTVTIRLADDDMSGNFSSGVAGVDFVERTLTVKVANEDPTASFDNSGPVFEGSPAVISFSNVFDPGEADQLAGFRYAYDFDNDGTFDLGDGTYSGSVAEASQVVPARLLSDGPSTRRVRARIIDKDEGFTDYTTDILVLNAPPVPDAGGPYIVDEGHSIALSATATDVAGDALTYEWDFDGDGAYNDATGANPVFDATNVDGPAVITVMLRVSDEDGASAFDAATITVANVPPRIDAGGPYVVDEGSDAILQATGADVSRDTLLYEWDFNGDGQFGDATGATPIFSAAGLDGPTEIVVRLRVSDDDGGFDVVETTVTVKNVAPRIRNFKATDVDSSGRTIASGEIDDPGSNDTFTLIIDWGDGTMLTKTLPAGTKAFSESHQYTTHGGNLLSPGRRQIDVVVTDDDQGRDVDGLDIPDPVGSIVVVDAQVMDRIPDRFFPSEVFQPPAPTQTRVTNGVPSFTFPLSDGGAGGQYLGVEDEPYHPPDEALAAERALQALLSTPRALRREEIVDAVHALGDAELVSLLGLDLGDEPVFQPPAKPAPQQPAPESTVALKPELPPDLPELPPSSAVSAYWATAALGGTLCIGGAWWWRRRRRLANGFSGHAPPG